MANVYFDINSQKDCIMMLKNYYNGNSYQVTDGDMDDIENRWGSAKMQNFRRLAQQQSSDVTQYQISDDDADEAYNQGKKTAEEKAGYERTAGKSFKQNATVACDAAGGVASAGAAVINGAQAYSGGVSAVTQNVGNAVGGGNSCLSEAGSGIIGCALAAALALIYRLTNPNKEEGKALEKLQGEMDEAANETLNAQAEMEMISAEIEEQAIEAEETNQAHQDEIDTAYADYATYNPVITEIEAKIAGGETLTDAEKQQYTDALKYSQEAGVTIDKNSTAATEEVGVISAEMGSNIAQFDDGAKIIQNVQGKTDMSASFDKTTERAANVEQISQYANAAGATASAIKALGEAGWWGIAAAAVGAAAAVSDISAAKEQGKISNVAATEVDKRVKTEDINIKSADVYETELENSVNNLDYVNDDLEIETPNDMEVHEEIAQAPQTDTEQNTANPNLFAPPEEEEEEA